MPLWHTCRPTPCRRPATNAPSYTASPKSGYRKEPEHFGPPFPRSPFHCPCMEISKTVPDAPGAAPPGLPGGRGTAFLVPSLDSPLVPAGRESPLVPMGRWRGIGAPPTACWLMGPGPPSRTEFRTTQSPKTVAAAEVLSGDADIALLRFERGVIGIKICLPPRLSSCCPLLSSRDASRATSLESGCKPAKHSLFHEGNAPPRVRHPPPASCPPPRRFLGDSLPPSSPSRIVAPVLRARDVGKSSGWRPRRAAGLCRAQHAGTAT